jgi:hypothetical protein
VTEPIIQPSTAGGLLYKCFARTFEAGASPVLYLLASGVQPRGGYQLFFRSDRDFHWTLYERVPVVAPDLTTWYVASTTTGQQVLDPPASVDVTDAFGTHQVPVEAWDSAIAAGAVAAAAEPGTVQPSFGLAIDYKVFSRPYDDASAPVLFLLASCYYMTGGWQIYFEGAGDAGWVLLEKVPDLVNFLITYYDASFTTAFGLVFPPQTAAIRDGWGTHRVAITPWT